MGRTASVPMAAALCLSLGQTQCGRSSLDDDVGLTPESADGGPATSDHPSFADASGAKPDSSYLPRYDVSAPPAFEAGYRPNADANVPKDDANVFPPNFPPPFDAGCR